MAVKGNSGNLNIIESLFSPVENKFCRDNLRFIRFFGRNERINLWDKDRSINIYALLEIK